jgi:L-ascorbate metabolism protein UlaG (beta-lactamase superfamily)
LPMLYRDTRRLRGFGLVVLASVAVAATDKYPASGGDIEITPIIHASVQLEHAGKVIHVDPWSVGDLSRAKLADLILITDDPGHHLDRKAIERLRKPGAPIVIPQTRRAVGNSMAKKLIDDGIPLANGESTVVAGVRVEATPAYDITPGDPYHPKGEANGYIITLGGRRIYFAGVTECIPEIRALKNIDVAFFPMNLPLARMEPAAAIECIKAFRPKVVYPYHYVSVATPASPWQLLSQAHRENRVARPARRGDCKPRTDPALP